METMVELDRAREEVARRDRERLQGVWDFVSGRREAELIVCGDHFTMRFRTGDIYVGTYTVDPTSRPRAMDLFIQEGPPAYRGKTALAIYEFDGDHLIWCPSEPGRGQRHPAFPPEGDPDNLCIVFKRQKPR